MIAPTPQEWAALGYKLVVIPRGSKAPKRTDWQNNPAEPAECEGANVGVIHGLSGTCSIDLDDLPRATAVLEALGLDVDSLAASTFAFRGRSDRLKLLFRAPADGPLPIRKLTPDSDRTATIIELRGAGTGTAAAQDVLPPSIHPDGHAYECVSAPRAVAELPEPPRQLLDVWRNWSQWRETLLRIAGYEAPRRTPAAKRRANGADSGAREAIEAFCASTPIDDVLARHGFERRGRRWIRPGSTTGTPGVVELEPGIVYAHDGSALADGNLHDAFDVVRILEHGGDWKAALRAVAPPETELRPDPGIWPDDAPAAAPGASEKPEEAVEGDDSDEGLPLLSGAEWARECVPPQWLLPGIMETRTLTVTIGGWNSGKSLIEMDKTLRIVGSLPWQGRAPDVTGCWVYVVGEGQKGFQRRLRAWSEFHQADIPLAWFAIPEAVLVGQKGAATALRQALEAAQDRSGLPLAGVTLDTLAMCFGFEDENSNSDMSRWVAILKATVYGAHEEACLSVLHHPGHGPKDRGRGASALPGAIENEFLTEVEEDIHTLRCNKVRDGDRPDPMYWKRHSYDLELGGELFSTPVIRECEEPPPSASDLPPKLRDMLECLTDMYREARYRLEEQGRSPLDARVDRDAWRGRCEEEGLSKNRDTFRSHVRRLKEAGVIVTDEPWIYPSQPRN